MPLPIDLTLELILLGLCSGFLAGLLGVGGGMVMVPLMIFVLGKQGVAGDVMIKMAVATSLATICFTSLSSVRAHHQRGAVRWGIVRGLAPGILLGSLIGAQIASAVPGKFLELLFSAFVAFSATQMFLDRKPKPSRGMPSGAGMLGAGGLIGMLSALVGAGGGFISVPFMTWCNVKIHEAVATSAALGFPIALAGTLGYVWAGWSLEAMPAGSLGYVYGPGLFFIAIASVLTAPVGARTAHRMDIRPLKRVFAVVLYALAGYFALR